MMKRRKNIAKYLLIYTLAFAAIALVVFFPFIKEGKSLIWWEDGIPQYMLWLKYTGRYLRDAVKNLLHLNFNLKMYDFNIGMGNDVRTFVNMEPILLLGILRNPGQDVAIFYDILVILRFYLAGLAFSLYAYTHKKKAGPILAGAMIYTFSSYSVYLIERHPQFGLAVIMLPILLIGLDQVIQKKNMLLYSFSVGLCLMGSYYLLYMLTLIMGLYALIRLFDYYDKHRIKEFFLMLGRIIVSYLFGCCLTIFAFIPTIFSFFSSSRASSGNGAAAVNSFLSYGKGRIAEILLGIGTPSITFKNMTTVSVTVLIFPALVLLFSRKRKEKLNLKIGFILSMLFLILPVFGFIFSGFSTVNNRWSYGAVLVLSLIILSEFEDFMEIKLLQYLIMLAGLVCYVLLARIYAPEKTIYLYGAVAYGIVLLLLGLIHLLKKYKPAMMTRRLVTVILCLMVCGSTALQGYYINASDGAGYVEEFQWQDTASTYFKGSRYINLAHIEDDSFYRDDTDMMTLNYQNSAVDLKYNGVSLYNSTIPGSMISYHTELESIGIRALNRIQSFDNRTVLDELACVKYFITNSDSDQNVPYGYVRNDNLAKNSKLYDIYENQYPLSIGYTYDSVMARSDYDKLDALNKQQIQSVTAVIDDDVLEEQGLTGFPQTTETTGDVSTGQVEITKIDEGLTESDGWYYAAEDQTKEETEYHDDTPKVHFSLPTKAGCEVYLRFKGLRCKRDVYVEVNVYTEETEKMVVLRPEEDPYNLGREDYLVNLGYFEDSENLQGAFDFGDHGYYQWDDIEVYYVSMDSYVERVNTLNAESLEDVTLARNTVSGSVHASQDHIMTFSIPYHSGWTVTVDGEKVDTFKVNTMYMGISLTAGDHDVVLTYASPGLKIGYLISIIACIIWLILFVFWCKKKMVHASGN